MALGVLSVVMIPLASVFYWGASTSAYNREHGDAIAIANGFLAKANSITYANLGFYENQFGALPQTVPSFKGQPGVDLGAAPAAGVTTQVPVTSTPQQVGSVVFNETTYIVWVNASGGDAYAYKQVYAVVSWTEGGNKATATQSILVYPGGQGTYNGPLNNPPGGTPVPPTNVAGLAVSVPADPAGETVVNLSWTPPVPPANPTGYYEAVWASVPAGGQADLVTPNSTGFSGAWDLPGSTASGSILGTASTYTVQGLAPSTAYWFEIVAFSSDGTQWATSQSWVTATTLTPPAQSCALSTLTVSQQSQPSGTATVKQNNSHLSSALSLTVTYSGSCTAAADVVTVDATSTGTDPGSPYTLAWSATGYTYSLCPAVAFAAPKTHTYAVSLNGSPINSIAAAQVAFSTTNGGPSC